MVKKSLDQYKGKLSPEQIAEGMNAAVRNAARLVNDAALLLERKRFPSAAALAILAIEEAGKMSILRRMSIVQDDAKALKDCWRDYRSHTKKNVAWLLPQLFLQGARGLDDLHPLYAKEAGHPFVLEQVKQIGLYTDCLGNAHWSIPENGVDEQLAKMLVQTARVLVKHPEATPKEIELWVKHMKPHLGAGASPNSDNVKQALHNWYADMQEHGLTVHSNETIEAFLYGSGGGG